jgi:hypothetical protein
MFVDKIIAKLLFILLINNINIFLYDTIHYGLL